MNETGALRAWVEELLLDKHSRLTEIERLRHVVEESTRLETEAAEAHREIARRLRAVERERDSMAKRIKAAEDLLVAYAKYPDASAPRLAEIGKALETPDSELPF